MSESLKAQRERVARAIVALLGPNPQPENRGEAEMRVAAEAQIAPLLAQLQRAAIEAWIVDDNCHRATGIDALLDGEGR